MSYLQNVMKLFVMEISKHLAIDFPPQQFAMNVYAILFEFSPQRSFQARSEHNSARSRQDEGNIRRGRRVRCALRLVRIPDSDTA